jgi:hypothetical protein
MGPDSTGGRRSRAIAKAAEATIRHGSRGIRLGRVSTKVPMLDRPRDLKGGKGGLPTRTLILTLTWVVVVGGGGGQKRGGGTIKQ